MKAIRICALFLLLLLLTGCSLWEKTVTVYCVTGYTYVDENGKELLREEYEYDRKGNLIATDATSEPRTYTYDRRGNVLTCTIYTSDDRPQYAYHLTYNRQGNLRRVRIVDAAGNLLRTLVYQYDSRGNQTSYTDYDADNTITDRYVQVYDDRNNCIEEISYDEKGQIRTHHRMTYDSMGRLLKHETASGAYYIYTYDSTGNILSEEKYLEDALYWRYVYTYDSQGNMLRRTTEGPQFYINAEIVCTYDAVGNKLSQTEYSSDRISWDKWTYDENGNIIVIERSKSGSVRQEYTYQAFTVSAAHAEKIKIAQSNMLFHGEPLFYTDNSPATNYEFVFPTGNHYCDPPRS